VIYINLVRRDFEYRHTVTSECLKALIKMFSNKLIGINCYTFNYTRSQLFHDIRQVTLFVKF